MRSQICLLTLCIYFAGHSAFASDFDVCFDAAEAIPGNTKTLVIYDDIEVYQAGSSELDMAMTGTFEYLVDLDNSYQCEMTTSFSEDNGMSFLGKPFGYPLGGCCNFFQTVYRMYGQPMFHNNSNFPIVTSDGPYPIPKGKYFVDQAILSDIYNNLPPDLLSGFWKVEFLCYDPLNNMIGGLRLFVTVT